MSRGGFKINRNSYEYARSERVDWLDNFADQFAKDHPKSAVEVARERDQRAQSIHDQIRSIIFNNPHHTVESKVKEMQDRTGLTEYLKRAADESATNKNDIFAKFGPQMKQDIISFCKNRISSYRGQIAIPAVQEDLLSSFRQQGLQPQDVYTEDVARFINNLIMDEQKLNPPTNNNSSDLGLLDKNLDDDSDNNDFFKSIMPNT